MSFGFSVLKVQQMGEDDRKRSVTPSERDKDCRTSSDASARHCGLSQDSHGKCNVAEPCALDRHLHIQHDTQVGVYTCATSIKQSAK